MTATSVNWTFDAGSEWMRGRVRRKTNPPLKCIVIRHAAFIGGSSELMRHETKNVNIFLKVHPENFTSKTEQMWLPAHLEPQFLQTLNRNVEAALNKTCINFVYLFVRRFVVLMNPEFWLVTTVEPLADKDPDVSQVVGGLKGEWMLDLRLSAGQKQNSEQTWRLHTHSCLIKPP